VAGDKELTPESARLDSPPAKARRGAVAPRPVRGGGVGWRAGQIGADSEGTVPVPGNLLRLRGGCGV